MNLISCEKVAISWRLVGTARGLKREKKKKETVAEGKRARERERGGERERKRGRRRGQEIRCEDVKMRRCEEERKERRFVKMCRCEVVKT